MRRLTGATKGRSGFTLIEIMIVVLILSMIILIAVPSWLGARERSQTRACIGQLREIQYAKETWAMENKKDIADTPTMDQLVAYLKSTPSCPSGGSYTLGAVNTNPTCSIGGLHLLY